MASHLRNLSTRAFSQSRTCTPASLPQTNNLLIPRSRPAFRNTTVPRLPTYPPFAQRNTMATSEAPKKMEWLVVIPDFPGVHEKRLEVRPYVIHAQHAKKDSVAKPTQHIHTLELTLP